MRISSDLLAAALCGALALAATPALAAINCEGNFQVQRSGARIATPYCEDNYLAEVAREYGAHVSAHEVRWNPSEKARLCRFMGYDIRVKDTCAPYLDNDRDHDWRH